MQSFDIKMRRRAHLEGWIDGVLGNLQVLGVSDGDCRVSQAQGTVKHSVVGFLPLLLVIFQI